MKILKGPSSTVLLPAPTLVLAMCQQRTGSVQDARHTLADAVAKFDWRTEKAVDTEAWIYHILRREAEALLIPNLHDILTEKSPAADADECLALQGACESEQLWFASARLYVEAFTADPTLADDLGKGRRFKGCPRSSVGWLRARPRRIDTQRCGPRTVARAGDRMVTGRAFRVDQDARR